MLVQWFKRWLSQNFVYGLQFVSNCEHFWKAGLCILSPLLTGCEQHWRFLWNAVSLHLFLTNREWVTLLHLVNWRQSHHIFAYDQQRVSDIVYFWERQSHYIFLMISSEWVTLHIFGKAVSSLLFLWPTGSEWQCTLCESHSHCIFSYG
jgi:hypothetical protein